MKVCEITGKVAIVGNNVSHSHHKTKRKFSPNLKINYSPSASFKTELCAR